MYFFIMQYIDVMMYYLRRKVILSKDLKRRVSTTDTCFGQNIVFMYEDFKKKGSGEFKVNERCVALKIMKGESMFCATHWNLLDDVVMPINVKAFMHWIVLHFNIQQRSLTVYDSMSGAKHENQTLPVIESFVVLIPLLLEKIGFYDHQDINIDVSPYDVAENEALKLSIATGIPQKIDCDCGMFSIYFAKQIILGKENEMPKHIDVRLLREDIAISLYYHGKNKELEGYLTSDEFNEKLLERRQKRMKIVA
ncbi:uncharacterized protein LOC133828794 [Humulus lupulus]|uniref:uncharacterized protein LOC133828794 n=1 Tax=Humulus lupulus TaxID=3486 RepID=UPI002B4062C7|nr:uncharacterized protein LOC133828794 [Humulus lupulus]